MIAYGVGNFKTPAENGRDANVQFTGFTNVGLPYQKSKQGKSNPM